jgi:hypothetical protein
MVIGRLLLLCTGYSCQPRIFEEQATRRSSGQHPPEFRVMASMLYPVYAHVVLVCNILQKALTLPVRHPTPTLHLIIYADERVVRHHSHIFSLLQLAFYLASA